ncbi:MAG TPA: TonB-dependent receptor [Croceibacterium sp.]|nr:TonB-dependent receptor [Croceibacterium sp.]
MKPLRLALLAATSLSISASPALAQDGSPAESREETPTSDDFHGPIYVTAAGVGRLDVLAGTSVLQGDDLQRNQAGTIGEVLARTPGVSATSFSPGASRPVLRGFQGDRVRVLTDGLGSIDASSTSADHAVTIDPLLTDRIEVLRGPAVLLYGSSAIGGAVNVLSKRIPPSVPDEPIHIDASAGADTAYDLREGAVSADVPLGKSIAFHIDGSWRKTGDVSVPGYVASDSLRARLLNMAAEEEEEGHLDEAAEFREGADTRGKIPNSATETYSVGAGFAVFSGGSDLGVSFGYYDTSYGIPGLPGVGHVHHDEEEGEEDHDHEGEHDHEREEGPVTIGMKQYRVDLRGNFDLGSGFFEKLSTRWGYSNYTHTEFEGDEIGTVFDVEGVEGRMELIQAERGGWRGSTGAQYFHQDFRADGEEAFVPPNRTDQYSLFTLQEIGFDPVELELGGRYEHTAIDAPTLGLSRDFDAVSGAAGLSYTVSGDVRVGVNGSRSERAPSAQELFADGPHIATQQFEIGDPALGKERAWGVEGYVRGTLGGARFSASVYRNWFDDFIYLAETGAEEDGLDVFEFRQQGADHFGVETEVSVPVYRGDGFTVVADAQGDYVRATLADGSPVPRIPPLSLLGALELQSARFDARAEVQWFDKQDRVAPLETPTDGFTHVNLSLAWKPLRGSRNVTVMLQANNLLDAEGRRHASFTKEYTPLAGRNLKLSVRTSF